MNKQCYRFINRSPRHQCTIAESSLVRNIYHERMMLYNDILAAINDYFYMNRLPIYLLDDTGI